MLNLNDEELSEREVLALDIAYDELPEKYYKEEEVQNYRFYWVIKKMRIFSWVECFMSITVLSITLNIVS